MKAQKTVMTTVDIGLAGIFMDLPYVPSCRHMSKSSSVDQQIEGR